MKKYRVKNKVNGYLFGEFSSQKEASIKLMEYLKVYENFSPFDYELEVVECGDVKEEITDFESACRYLALEKRKTSLYWTPLEDAKRTFKIERLVEEINEKNIEALVALNQLLTIAEAWNKADGFVPDFSDMEQDKWFPTFLKDENARLVFNRTISKDIGTKLCFKDPYRARQFGEQFTDLYNKLIL